MLLRELSVPSLVGLHCMRCFDDGSAPQLEGPPRATEPPRLEASAESLALLPRITPAAAGRPAAVATAVLAAAGSAWRAAVSSAGAVGASVCFEVTLRAGGEAGVGFATAECARRALAVPSPRAGSVVLFGDGTVWLGTEVARSSQRFGAGDVLTVGCAGEAGEPSLGR